MEWIELTITYYARLWDSPDILKSIILTQLIVYAANKLMRTLNTFDDRKLPTRFHQVVVMFLASLIGFYPNGPIEHKEDNSQPVDTKTNMLKRHLTTTSKWRKDVYIKKIKINFKWVSYNYQPIIIGLIETASYPLLMVNNLYSLIGAWIAFKTVPHFFEWGKKRHLYHSYLLSNLLVIIMSVIILTYIRDNHKDILEVMLYLPQK